MNTLIVGYGEVGSAMYRILRKSYHFKPDVHDPVKNRFLDKNKHYDIVHICFPYSDHFISDFDEIQLDMYERKKLPSLFIINSTIPVKIDLILRNTIVIHQPVRGTHPDLYQGIKENVNFIGMNPKDAQSKYFINDYYRHLNIPYRFLTSNKETALGKLIDTTWYYINIRFCNMIKGICDREGIDFDEAYTQQMETDVIGRKYTYRPEFNRVMCDENIPRPVMSPGKVGGHCLVPNLEILKEVLRNDKFYNWLNDKEDFENE